MGDIETWEEKGGGQSWELAIASSQYSQLILYSSRVYQKLFF